jgi:prolyl-tRNA editing enzyme YbaK/EbsC (Cys-tRNA(Pro) deacylase)
MGIHNIYEVYQPREKEFQGAYAFRFSTFSSRKGIARRAPSSVDEDAHSRGLLFMVDDRPVLAITSGANRIDRRRIAKNFGVGRKRVRLADENQVQTATGYPVGAVPPFGHPEPLLTLIDSGILKHDVVYAGGGASDHLMRVETAEILRVTQGEVLELVDRSE